MTYLELCQNYVQEFGLSGGSGPSHVTGNSILELTNVTRWIRDACTAIDQLWMDWRYLWCQYAETATANAQTLPLPDQTVRMWDPRKMRFRQSGVTGAIWQSVDYYDRVDFLIQFDPDNAVAGAPVAFTIMPDNSVFFSAPFDAAYDFKGEFWQRPPALAADADIPMMPAEYHRIILARAAVYYGNREDAPEIIQGLEAEYVDLLDKLESDQLEGYALRRSSTDRERAPRTISLSEFLR